MTEYAPKTIGTLYAVTVNGAVLAHKNGKPKTFSTWSKASKTAQKLGEGGKGSVCPTNDSRGSKACYNCT